MSVQKFSQVLLDRIQVIFFINSILKQVVIGLLVDIVVSLFVLGLVSFLIGVHVLLIQIFFLDDKDIVLLIEHGFLEVQLLDGVFNVLYCPVVIKSI